MVEKAKCSSCENKRTILCPCCSGMGCVQLYALSPHMGKMYICADCTGSGKVPCPICCPTIETKHPRAIQLKEIELRFGQA